MYSMIETFKNFEIEITALNRKVKKIISFKARLIYNFERIILKILNKDR
jgi:hypothetical protein